MIPMARRWSKKALRDLLDGIGSYGIVWFQRKANAPGDYEGAERSRQAIYNAALRLCGPGGLTRGTYTVNRLARDTGFSKSHLYRARNALRQKWKRLGPRGAHIITEEQVQDILEWLKHDYWSKSKRLYCCAGCQTEKRPHRCLGLCQPCYFRYRRRLEGLGIPTDRDDLLSRMANLEVDKNEIHGKVLEAVIGKLESGRALSELEIEWVYTWL